ncbi:hypothetical protein [Streptomyces griseicoloratus]|uniref:hypothetical protein n=1 Tax=Streptomyces griseicoloratus TaxID=2752516 RepID=UPI001CB70EE3|nr:hypothetical protein [Streptomyces griseicoloratus]
MRPPYGHTHQAAAVRLIERGIEPLVLEAERHLQPLADVLGDKVRFDATVTGVARPGRVRRPPIRPPGPSGRRRPRHTSGGLRWVHGPQCGDALPVR